MATSQHTLRSTQRGRHWAISFVLQAEGLEQYNQEDIDKLTQQMGATLATILLMPQEAQKALQVLRDLQFDLAKKASDQIRRGGG
jgi:hypothetical protein